MANLTPASSSHGAPSLARASADCFSVLPWWVAMALLEFISEPSSAADLNGSGSLHNATDRRLDNFRALSDLSAMVRLLKLVRCVVLQTM